MNGARELRTVAASGWWHRRAAVSLWRADFCQQGIDVPMLGLGSYTGNKSLQSSNIPVKDFHCHQLPVQGNQGFVSSH